MLLLDLGVLVSLARVVLFQEFQLISARSPLVVQVSRGRGRVLKDRVEGHAIELLAPVHSVVVLVLSRQQRDGIRSLGVVVEVLALFVGLRRHFVLFELVDGLLYSLKYQHNFDEPICKVECLSIWKVDSRRFGGRRRSFFLLSFHAGAGH